MVTEGFSFYIPLVVGIAILGIAITGWVRRPPRRSEEDAANVIRKNVKRRCRECGAPVVCDVFAVNPTCVSCQDNG